MFTCKAGRATAFSTPRLRTSIEGPNRVATRGETVPPGTGTLCTGGDAPIRGGETVDEVCERTCMSEPKEMTVFINSTSVAGHSQMPAKYSTFCATNSRIGLSSTAELHFYPNFVAIAKKSPLMERAEIHILGGDMEETH